MNLKYSVFILSIGVALSVEASNTESMKEALKQQVSQAIEGFEKTDRSAWGFRVSRYENEEGDVTSSVEHYDPSAVDHNQWSLLRINGETPSEKQAQKFVDKKRKETAKKADKSFSMSLREIIQIDSLQLEAEDQENLNAIHLFHF